MDPILTEPIKDLQPPISFDNPELSSWWLVPIVLGLVLLVWMIILFLKKSKLSDPPLPPDQLAVESLQDQSIQSAGSILRILKNYLYASLEPLSQEGFTSEEFFQMPESKKLSMQKITDLKALFSQLEPLAFSGQNTDPDQIDALRQQAIQFIQSSPSNLPENTTP